MSNSDPITLQNIQDYAEMYFPTEFAKLPPVGKLHWTWVSPYRTKAQLSLKIARLKLFLGRDALNQAVWAHQSLDRSNELYKLCGQERTLHLACPLPLTFNLSHRFKGAIRDSTTAYRGGGQKRGCELQTLIQYYFMLG